MRLARYFFLFLTMTVLAFSHVEGALAEESLSDRIYLDMVKRSENMPDTYDFKLMRGTYEQTSFFDPVKTRPNSDLQFLTSNIESKAPYAEKMLHDYVTKNYPLPEVHTILAFWYEKRGDKEKTRFHTWLANGFLNALVRTGTGKNEYSPYRILNMGEIDIVTAMLGFQHVSVQEASNAGRIFRVVTAKNPKTGKLQNIYYDISAVKRKEALAKNPPAEKKVDPDDERLQ